MKYVNTRLLEKHLSESSAQQMPFYFIVGKENQEVQEAVQMVLKSLSSSHGADYIFDASQIQESQFWLELESTNFFTNFRVIWIQHAEKLKKSIQEQLEKYFLRPSRSHCLIFSASTVPKSSLYQLADEKGVVLELPDVKPWEKEKKAIEWVSHQATAVRKTMAYPACQLLVKQIGVDYALLSQEMDKLLCYCENKTDITPQDVQAICSVLQVDSIFQLGEAIFQRKIEAALHSLQTLLTDGQAALPLIKQIRSQFQTSFQVALLLAQERPIQDITKEFPYMKGQILDRQIQQAKQYGLKSFQEGILMIDKTEYGLKNSVADPHLLIELLIIQLIQCI